MLSIIPKLRCICSSKQCIIICMSSWWISKENVWKLPISDIGCQQYDGRHTSHCHRTENNAEAFFLANKLSFDLVKIAIQRYFISNLPICNGKKLTWTKLILSPAPEWRMFHFYLLLHLSLNLCPDIYESGCTDICLGKLIERVLAPPWRSLSTQTEWHTACTNGPAAKG